MLTKLDSTVDFKLFKLLNFVTFLPQVTALDEEPAPTKEDLKNIELEKVKKDYEEKKAKGERSEDEKKRESADTTSITSSEISLTSTSQLSGEDNHLSFIIYHFKTAITNES